MKDLIRILGFFKEMKWRILAVVLVGSLSIVMFAFMPSFLRSAFDALRKWTAGEISDPMFLVIKYLIIFGILAGFNGIFDIFCQFVILKAEQKVKADKIAEAKRKLDVAPMSFFQKETAGNLSRTVASITGQIVIEFLNTVYMISRTTVFFITTSIMMFMINWILAVVVILSLPLCIFVARFVSKRTQKYFMNYARASAITYTHVDQKFSMQDFWALHGLEDNGQVYAEINEQNVKATIGQDVATAFNALYINYIQNFMYLLVTFLFGVLYVTQAVPTDFGVLPAFIMYSNRFLANAVVVTTATNLIQGIMARAPRVFQILDIQETVTKDEHITIEKIKRNIEFQDVVVEDGDEVLLNKASFTIPQGSNVAFVGATGCGKGQIVDLLAKMITQTSGQILVDGIPLNEITSKSYYKCIGVALENPFIFRGTIAENLLYGVRRELPENVMNVTEQLGSHEFIAELPKGYETYLSENASILGQGQKQAICIARLVLQNPDIAIFDEALSSTDNMMERDVYEKIMKINKRQTNIFVTTRLSSVEKCDLIFYMERGKIVEAGTHKELMALRGRYFKAYTGG